METVRKDPSPRRPPLEFDIQSSRRINTITLNFISLEPNQESHILEQSHLQFAPPSALVLERC